MKRDRKTMHVLDFKGFKDGPRGIDLRGRLIGFETHLFRHPERNEGSIEFMEQSQ